MVCLILSFACLTVLAIDYHFLSPTVASSQECEQLKRHQTPTQLHHINWFAFTTHPSVWCFAASSNLYFSALVPVHTNIPCLRFALGGWLASCESDTEHRCTSTTQTYKSRTSHYTIREPFNTVWLAYFSGSSSFASCRTGTNDHYTTMGRQWSAVMYKANICVTYTLY